MKILLGFLKPFWKYFVAMMVLYMIEGACALFMPFIMSNIIEYGIREGNMDYIFVQGAIMIVIAGAYLGTSILANKVLSILAPKLSGKMRMDTFNKVNSLSFEQFSAIGTNSLITRVTEDIGWLEEVAGFLAYVFVMVPVMFIGGVIMTLLGDWVLALILLAASPLVLFLAWLITRGMFERWEKADKYADLQNKIIRERLSGIRVIRAFNKDEYEHKRAERATRVMCENFVKNNTISGTINPIVTLLLNIVTIVVIYIGTTRLQSLEYLKAGDIIATIQYIALIGNAIFMLSWALAFLPHIKVSMGRIDEVLKMPVLPEEQSAYEVLEGSVEFKNVSFKYLKSNADVLSDINIDIKNGEIVGIIGGTGSGKTTLMKLLMAFYNEVGGERSLGGKDYKGMTPKAVRDNISIALQKSMIFEGTVKENILMGNKDATDEEIDRAINIAQLREFVDGHEEGLLYELKQAGSNISGGQKQRINIARCILKKASVYIFDDSFSALDFLTERNLRKELNKYLDGKTQIIITQRAATAMRCDKVYVLDAGKIVGFGTHKELLQSCDVYREIYDSQLGGEK